MDAPNNQSAYDMSVIVPVYNKEHVLDACIESLDAQTAPQRTFEVILVDDGSVDDSLARCNQIARERDNYVVISKTNGGVSSARNAGIRAARGRYLMFLDADDSISARTVHELVHAFDRQANEVDLLSYPITYINSATGETNPHDREQWLRRNHPYALADYPFVAQTTINVCVRKRKENPWLFDESLAMGEDQLFATTILAERATIGNCTRAEYRYVRDPASASAAGNYPVFAFDQMIYLYTKLLDFGDADPRMTAYVESMVIYNLGWRLRSNMLFPEFGDDELRARNHARLREVLSCIGVQSWLTNPYVADELRTFLFKTFCPAAAESQVRYTPTATQVVLADGQTFDLDLPEFYADWLVAGRDGVEVRGRLRGPGFVLGGTPTLFMKVDGHRQAIELTGSSLDYSTTHTRVARSWDFAVTLPPLDTAPYEAAFELHVDGVRVPSFSLLFGTRRSNARALSPTLREFARHRMRAKGQSLIVVPRRDATTPVLRPFGQAYGLAHDLTMVGERSLTCKLRLRLPGELAACPKERVWLYSDLPTSPSKGNALVQLLHDLSQDDDIQRFYITAHAHELVEQYPQLKGHVVAYGSHDHVLQYARAELIAASYLEVNTFLPYPWVADTKLRDLYMDRVLVYLQHGILHAHIPWYFSYDRISFDYMVISTEFERQNLMNNYLFPAHALLDTGAPRMEAVPNRERQPRRIAYVPSWRGYLVAGNSKQRVGLEDRLLASSFYKGVQEFVAELTRRGTLERHGYELDFKLHPNFNVYQDAFTFEDEHITLVDHDIDTADYAIVITDFSSYIYDFVYTGARPLFFLPDRLEFESGVNHYSQLDLPQEEGFGAPCYDAVAAADRLEQLIEEVEAARDASTALSSSAPSSFFLHEDGRNAERLYQRFRKITEGLA